MTAALLAIALLAAGALAGAAYICGTFARGRSWLERLEVEPVVVELHDQRTVAGILVAVHADVLVLRQARVLSTTGNIAYAGGEIVVPRDRVAWIQRGVKIDDVGDHVAREVA